MMNLLAETVSDPMISGNWIIAVIGAGTTLLGSWWAHKRGMRKQRLTLDEPMPTVPTRHVYSPPTWDQHKALADRVKKLESGLHEIFVEGSAREQRLSDKLAGIAETQAGLMKSDELTRQRMASMESKMDVLIFKLTK